MKKFFCAMMFALMFGSLAFSVQPVKADTLDERVGALAVDTALSSFVDVLPSPEAVESLGGVQSWLGKVGQQFKEAWERDERNWQNFVDSIDGLIDDSFGSVFEVSESVLESVRDVVYNFYNLIFGLDYEVPSSYPTDDSLLAYYIDSYNQEFARNPYSTYSILIGDSITSGEHHKSFVPNHSSTLIVVSVETDDLIKFYNGSFYSNSDYVTGNSLTVLYWGGLATQLRYRNRTVESFEGVSVNFINMGGTSVRSFVPKVDNQFFNNYYFGFGNGATVSPSRIVNNYETVYNFVSNNSYTDAVKETKESPKGFWQKIKDALGNVHISIGGFGGVDIDFPDTDSFDSLYGDSDTSSVMSVENSSWLSFFSVLPSELITMLVIAVAVGCVCIIIKAVR